MGLYYDGIFLGYVPFDYSTSIDDAISYLGIDYDTLSAQLNISHVNHFLFSF